MDLPMPLLPPGGLMEIVFSFDTTGSMSRAIEEVKGRVNDMIQRLQADIPGIRIGVVAHGDYCDKDVFYLEKHVDLTNNVAELCELVKDVEGTGGGDPEECYEYILRLVSEFSWTPGSQKALVMIGDATPHEPEYDLNVDNLDWRKEAENLFNMGVKVYAVQAFDNADSTEFFEELVTIMSGQHLQLKQFSNICDLIMAICYREKGGEFLEDYEAEVRARNKRKSMNKDLEGMFATLKRGDSSASAHSGPSGAAPLVRDVSIRSNRSARSVASRGSVAAPSKSRSRSRSPISRSNSPSPARSRSSSPISSGSSDSGVAVNVKDLKKVVKAKKVKAAGAGKSSRKPKAKGDVTLRHKVDDSKFIMHQGNMKKRWSKWKLAISDTEPKSKLDWVQRSGRSKLTKDKLGWRKKELFKFDSSLKHVFYEMGVQVRPRGKMHVVYSKWSTLSADPLTWEKRMMSHPAVQSQVESILRLGCKIYVRRFEARGLGKNQKKTMLTFRRTYEYPWPEKKLTIQINGKVVLS